MIRTMTAPRAVYIHIPFCTNKCHYCDFNSYVLKGQPVMEYLQALECEMAMTVEQIAPGEVETIFVGGGTPTVLLPEQMEYFLNLIQKYYPIRADQVEFTMEANPGTTDEAKLEVMKAGGVNRISFGVQSFNNQILANIGRIHSTDDVYRSIENARKVGFTNLSIDLMFGLPNQTLEMVEESLAAALSLDLQHYSIYGLIVEENTRFHTLYQKNLLPLPDEEVELQMYLHIMDRLKAAGYKQYEISNFALPGYESRHNMMYWHNHSYYGLGAGAHGYVDGCRHVNVKAIQPYIDATSSGLPRLESSVVSRIAAMEDFMMVGLRMLQGVKQSDFQAQFDRTIEDVFAETIQQLMKQDLIQRTEEGYCLSAKGILFGNEAFAAFLA